VNFRNALQVSPDLIARLSDKELSKLIGDLLRAQAYVCDADVSEVSVNAETSAADDGCDAWSPAPRKSDSWLKDCETCWQLKAGRSGEPQKLSGEVTKAIPEKTLRAGGGFVLVASGSKNGIKGIRAREKILRDDARESGIPDSRIRVMGSEALASWCDEHPAIAARLCHRPDGLIRLDDWILDRKHRPAWQESESSRVLVEQVRSGIDLNTGTLTHLHIHGPPGVGKTRLAMEICRDAAWREFVLYIRDAGGVQADHLIQSIAAEPGVRLVLVIDEAQSADLELFSEAASRCNGRVRLVTIGHGKSPDRSLIPGHEVTPLSEDAIDSIVRSLHPGIPIERSRFVARFAGGYVRLAMLAAPVVASGNVVDVRGLLGIDEVTSFLGRMLGGKSRNALYVVAVLTRVGWDEDREIEGQSIADHLGMNWADVKSAVAEFDRSFGIVAVAGRYRYVSPKPLAMYLAVEAWTLFASQLRTLPDALPSDDARASYFERLRGMASSPQAGQFAREELKRFFSLADLASHRAARRWSALSAADPEFAATWLASVLGEASRQQRLQLEGQVRRELVGTLVRLCWRASAFVSCARSLARLAQAENESWANNASGEFVARYQLWLGGTAMPYLQRLVVVDELITSGETANLILAIRALALVGLDHHSRGVSPPPNDEIPEEEWRPRSFDDLEVCVEGALCRLESLAVSADPQVTEEMAKAVEKVMRLLRSPAFSPQVARLLRIFCASNVGHQERFRKMLNRMLRSDTLRTGSLEGENFLLEQLRSELEDKSLSGQFRQVLSELGALSGDGEQDLTRWAQLIVEDREFLQEQWDWLISGAASDAWRLGAALAACDKGGSMERLFPSLPSGGRDYRLVSGYISVRREMQGVEWYDRWVSAMVDVQPRPLGMFLDVVWRCGATNAIACKLIALIGIGDIDAGQLELLSYGKWGEDLSQDRLEAVLRALASGTYVGAAVKMLVRRLESHQSERETWRELSLVLALNSKLIRSGDMDGYHWKLLAESLLPANADELAQAIVQELSRTGDRASPHDLSDAGAVLIECAKVNPSGVWRAISQRLDSPGNSNVLSVWLPKSVWASLSTDEVGRWVDSDPKGRGKTLARLIAMDFSTDVTHASRLLGKHGDVAEVARECFGAFFSGSWSGQTSAHWEGLARSLDEVSGRSSMPKLVEWCKGTSRNLRAMVLRERAREQEEDLDREG
jgi:DNA polymerase III delta prime subunit